MKVFLVLEAFDYEGFEVDSVWSNRSGAKKRKAELEAGDISWTIEIMEKELQE
jgi:hypothetical protein